MRLWIIILAVFSGLSLLPIESAIAQFDSCNVGEAALNSEDYARAVTAYTECIHKFPKYAYAYSYRGEARLYLGEIEAAFDDYSFAVALRPLDAWHYYERGRAYMHVEDFAAAVQDFSRAIELYATDPEYFQARGDAFWELGDVDHAIADYRSYEQLNGHLEFYMESRVAEPMRRFRVWPLFVLIAIAGVIGYGYWRFVRPMYYTLDQLKPPPSL